MKFSVTLPGTVGLLLTACSTAPNAPPHPLQTANGRLGFSVSGIAQFTRDEAAVEGQVRRILENACGGAIEVQSMDFVDASSRAGTPHTAYSAVAECKT